MHILFSICRIRSTFVPVGCATRPPHTGVSLLRNCWLVWRELAAAWSLKEHGVRKKKQLFKRSVPVRSSGQGHAFVSFTSHKEVEHSSHLHDRRERTKREIPGSLVDHRGKRAGIIQRSATFKPITAAAYIYNVRSPHGCPSLVQHRLGESYGLR